MTLAELTSLDAVREAMGEFDALGRDEFLRKYGFGRSQRYFIRHDGRLYDSKAIVGAAFGHQYPERGPLSHQEFSGGETTVKRRLEQLGFSVEDRSPDRNDGNHRVWLVRAGRDGRNEELALSENAAVIGWDELPDLANVTSRNELEAIFKRVYPDEEDPQSAGQQIGQVFRFVRDIAPGDLVVLPL